MICVQTVIMAAAVLFEIVTCSKFEMQDVKE